MLNDPGNLNLINNEQNIFVLGIGAQKCGTTWLHDAISKSGKANMGPLKEYQIWNAKRSTQGKHRVLRLRDVIKRPKKTYLIRYAMLHFDGFYEYYFRKAVSGHYSITGDITPAYSILNEAALSNLKERLERSGFKLKVFFLMRDPFERCWSALRMNRRKNGALFSAETEEMKNRYTSEAYQFRTRYELIAERIDRVFEKDQVFYGIYEELFTPDEIQRISNFLNIEIAPELVKKRKNSSPKDQAINPLMKRKVMEFYADTYQYCYARFPQTKQLWNQFD
jgi:hypothetical protein